MDLLGPASVVAGEEIVSLQCVCSTATYQHHAAYTNNKTFKCNAEEMLVVFCGTDGEVTSETRFVGVIQSEQQKHGAHAHVTVAVSGAVTLAVVLSELDGWRPMQRLGFTATPSSDRIAGGPHQMLASCRADDRSSIGTVGTLLQLGRAPSNEIRVLLSPDIPYVQYRARQASGGKLECMTVEDIQYVTGQNTDLSAQFAKVCAMDQHDVASKMIGRGW